MRNGAGNLGIADSMNGTAFLDFDQTEKTKDIDEQGLHSNSVFPPLQGSHEH